MGKELFAELFHLYNNDRSKQSPCLKEASPTRGSPGPRSDPLPRGHTTIRRFEGLAVRFVWEETVCRIVFETKSPKGSWRGLTGPTACPFGSAEALGYGLKRLGPEIGRRHVW